jgi:hypothetical protein
MTQTIDQANRINDLRAGYRARSGVAIASARRQSIQVVGWNARPNEWAVTSNLNEYSSQDNETKIVDTLNPRSRAATPAVYAGGSRNG